MAELIRKFSKFYQLVFIDYNDPRTENLFLVAKPYQGLILLGFYLMFVFKWGPRWMKNRQPFNINKILIVYNAIQIVLCSLIFIKGLTYWGWGGKYKWICEPCDDSYTEDALNVTRIVHLYFLTKIIDLLDTVFFVLRKKNKQVSFLHVYHHAGMVMLIWGAVTYYPGGHGTFVGFVNSFVHMVMYSYYLLSITTPRIRNMVWIKKAVTQMQIIQFLLFVLHMGVLVFQQDCQYPRWTAAVFLPQNFFMLILFIEFYYKTYIREPVNKKTKLENGSDDGMKKRVGMSVDVVKNNDNKKANDVRKIDHFIINHHNDSILIARNVKRT